MRGSVALQAALGLLWSTSSPTSLVTALAIESPSTAAGAVPPEHLRVVSPEARDEGSVDALSSDDTATAFVTFEVPDDDGEAANDDEDAVLSYTLALQITPADTPCGPANISVASQTLSIDADGTGHASFSPSADNTVTLPFEASWSVHCLPSADPEGEPSQLLHFDITTLSGRALESGLLSFVAQFRQHTPAEILSVAGSAASVTFQGAFLAAGPHADERDKSLLEDIARLEALRHRLSDIEDAIVTLEEHIASSYGVEASALGIKGAAPSKDGEKNGEKDGEKCTEFKCTMHKVVNDLSGTAKKLFDELFGDGKNDDNTTTVTRPKSGLEHPIVVTPSESHDEATPSSTASEPDASSPAIRTSGDYSMPENIMLFLPAVAMIVGIAVILLCARRRRHRCKEEAQSADEETGFLARMRARRRRRAAKRERAEAVKAGIRGFFRQLFCRPCPTDAEKEAERQRILEDLGNNSNGASSSSAAPAPRALQDPSWVTVDLEQATFVVGRDSEDESPYQTRDRRGRTADAESITLVGSERDDDESDSEASTTMEMDLARFREATFMVGNMVNARAGAASAPPRRPASPAGSLPGYASDDPYPTGWGGEAEESEESEDEDAAVPDGFAYRPGTASQGPRPRASLDAKN